MMKLFTTVVCSLFCWSLLIGQTKEEVLAKKAAKEAELAILQPQLNDLSGRVDALKNEIVVLIEQTSPYPRWDLGVHGNAGLNFASFSDWLSKSNPNTTVFNIAFSGSGYAHLQQRKYFWRNNANLTVGWVKFNDRDDPTDNHEFRVAADAFNANTLFGYKLNEKFALSTLG